MERSFNQLENQEQKGESQEQIEQTVGSHLNKIVEEAEKILFIRKEKLKKLGKKEFGKLENRKLLRLEFFMFQKLWYIISKILMRQSKKVL
jgi:hypothetical protein